MQGKHSAIIAKYSDVKSSYCEIALRKGDKTNG